jgi:L-ascorbate metabolism protein UlaG (beta-lactamase superfamily)
MPAPVEHDAFDPAGGAAPAPAARITWLGHATVLLELDGVRLLTDPVLGVRVGPLVRHPPPVASDTLPPIDAVLLSHLHADHADARSLRRIGAHTRVIAPPGARGWLRARGMENVDELGTAEWTRVGGVGVCATPARHGGSYGLRPRAAPAGFLISGTITCYFAGDTDLFEGMGWLAGGIDVALLPVAGWGPRLGPGHLDPARAAVAAHAIGAPVAIPIHWGTLAPAWVKALRPDMSGPGPRFADELARRGDTAQACVLAPGDTLTLAVGDGGRAERC